MKILSVGVRETPQTITLYAKCKIRAVGYDEAYFTFDKKYKKFLQADASPFAAALLLPCMKLGEDLIIKGAISKQLYDGMHRIMDIVLGWDIGLKRISIKADSVVADKTNPTLTGTFFSGGVDSFYTYLKHKQNISHLLLVNGYDIDPRNKDLWRQTQQNVQAIAVAENVELIEVQSNMRALIDPILIWDYAHGGCLAAVGLCLRGGFKHIFIPSSYTAEQQFPWGSHLTTDHLWGTETLGFEHDGTEASRVNKVVWQVAKSSSALKHLRVCYWNVKGTYNCGVCDKCLRTMINLQVAGALHKSQTFPQTIDIQRVAAVQIEGEHGAIFHKENLQALREQNILPELQDALQTSLKNVAEPTNSLQKKLIARALYLDHQYTRGNVYRVFAKITGKNF